MTPRSLAVIVALIGAVVSPVSASVRMHTATAPNAPTTADGTARDFAEATGRYWQQAAEIDVAAAVRMLETDHPGASPEVDDEPFKRALATGSVLAKTRAQAVRSYEGYAAMLTAFANSFGDAHLRSRPVLRVAAPDWASLVVGVRGNQWTVVDEVPVYPAPLTGATLIACDGIPVDELARVSLGTWRIDWQVRAQRVQAAAWLLVDEHNPFLKRPKSCVFGRNGQKETIALQWSQVALPVLLAKMQANTPYGAAGFGIRQVDKGYWIAIQSFDKGALPVVRQTQAMASTLRQAPFVVMDLRGNRGGSSSFGADIATAILGHPSDALPSDATSGGVAPECDTSYRASDGNIAEFRKIRAANIVARGPEWAAIIDDIIDRMTLARNAGRALTGPTTCVDTKTVEPVLPRTASPIGPRFSRRVFMITDGACFSACLAVVDAWRELGAVQLGQETSANTTYIEVREPIMPSGQSTFSSMMGLSPRAPGAAKRLGPFIPHTVFDGDITDTRAVENWVRALVERG